MKKTTPAVPSVAGGDSEARTVAQGLVFAFEQPVKPGSSWGQSPCPGAVCGHSCC